MIAKVRHLVRVVRHVLGFGEHFCDVLVNRSNRERPSDRWSSLAFDRCKHDFPEVFEVYLAPKEEPDEPRRERDDEDPASYLFSEQSKWAI